MSGRYNESLIFAYDKEGEWCLVEQGYSYSGGCGDYHNRVEIKDKFYDVYVNVNCDPGDEYEEVTGTYLPYTCVTDYASYFSSAPTNTIQTVLQEAELTDMNFSRFLIIDIYGTASVMFNVECILISEEGVSRKEHNFARKTFSGDLGDVVETLLSIYDPKTNNNKRSNPATGLDR